MKHYVSVQWMPNPAVKERGLKVGITVDIFNRTLEKFRGTYYRDDPESNINDVFWRRLLKALETHKRRSQSQKARHYKRQEHVVPADQEEINKSDLEHGKSELEKIKGLLK